MALKLRKNKIEDVDIDTGNADEIPLKDSAQADN